MTQRSRIGHRLAATAAVALTMLAACGETPEETEAARGVIGEANLVLVLTVVFVVVAGGIVVAAIAYDRYVRSRRALEEAEQEAEEPEDEEEEETEVAGIGMGTGGVPRWLYAVYVIIPVFAFLYVVTNVQVAEAPEEAGEPAETEAPDGGGPDASLEVSAENIAFDTDELVAPANTEITLTFENNDSGVPHNVAVYQSDAASEEIFVGEIFDGVATEEYTFTTPEAGEYYFVCDVHPNMNGTFVVEGAEGGEANGGEAAAGASAEISAENIEFDKEQLTLAANTDVTLAFENNDSSVPHNVAVYQSDAASEEVFVGEIFDGVATEEYTFTTPGPGEYFFRCDVHPSMQGTLVVEGSGEG